MTKEDIFKTLEELYSNKKSRNFINHLVRSYFPNDKVSKVLDKPEKGAFKCLLTKQELVSVNEVLVGIHEESFKEDFMNNIKNAFKEDSDSPSAIEKLLNGKVLGFTGSGTDTFMSLDAYINFHDWVLTKFLKGDKHMSWLLKDVNKRNYTNRGKSANTNRPKRTESKPKGATFSLGDLSALQELKKRMG